MTPIAPLITGFLREHLPIERGYSPHTCETYAHAFRLLFTFASRRLGDQTLAALLEQIDARHDPRLSRRYRRPIAATVRPRATGDSPRSRRSCGYVELPVPSALEQARQIHAIPVKRHDRTLVRHLTMDEVRAVLDAPDTATRLGIRDRAMLHLCFAGGLRVSELVGLRCWRTCTLQRTPSIRVLGKGRKERCLPLWKETAADLRAWLAVRGAVRRTGAVRQRRGGRDDPGRLRIRAR